MTHYPTTFIDKYGEEHSSFVTDGKSLQINLRDETFVGQNFDSLELEIKENNSSINFSFNKYDLLTNCCFKIKFPLKLIQNSKRIDAFLNVEILLEDSKLPNTKTFKLMTDDSIFDLQNDNIREMCFETQMIQLQRLLPSDIKINSCIFCAYSNYWVAGSDSFGTLHCYKSIKDEIITVDNKRNYMNIAYNRSELTQETFWCSEFREILKNQWQYKDEI